MKKVFFRAAWFVLLLQLSFNASALPTEQLQQLQLQQLAEDPQWLALLHMRRTMAGVLRSEVDEPGFFIAEFPVNSVNELRATIDALASPVSGESSAWCLYPARAAWLVEKKIIEPPRQLECRELQRWRNQFNSDKLVLVFPTMYMDNPASLFGHTFLRFDAENEERHPVLLSRALSYYADVGSAGSTVSYILQGLGGNFDGVFEVRHYFEKIKKYSDNEDRDIWEYELNLSHQQILTFIDHAWEVRGHTFHYFFLDENCSYRLIAMLDTVVSPFTMRKAFLADAMPLDTVRVLYENNLVRKATYVPSAAKMFQREVNALSVEEQNTVTEYLAGDVAVEDIGQKASLRVLSDYAALQMRQDVEHRATHAQQLHALLEQSAQLQAENPDESLVANHLLPAFKSQNPAEVGHGTRRVRAGVGVADGRSFRTVGARLAYHDMMDPVAGFDRGLQLEALDVEWHVDNDSVDLDHITWFSVQSRKTRNGFFQPASWETSVARRRELLGSDRELVNAIDGARGLSYECGEWLCSMEMTSSVLGGDVLDKSWALGVGGRVGAVYQRDNWNVAVQAVHLDYLTGESHTLHSASAALGYRLGKNLSVTAGYEVQDNGNERREELSTGIRYFY